jgi:hypothetical protein
MIEILWGRSIRPPSPSGNQTSPPLDEAGRARVRATVRRLWGAARKQRKAPRHIFGANLACYLNMGDFGAAAAVAFFNG